MSVFTNPHDGQDSSFDAIARGLVPPVGVSYVFAFGVGRSSEPVVSTSSSGKSSQRYIYNPIQCIAIALAKALCRVF
jgi:hypothetical protein